jgi:predicted DNA-binding antitoxin AbrB/MazE fold protein
MSIQIHATYRGGVIHPDRPLGLPENTQIDVMVVPINDQNGIEGGNIRAIRPSAPVLSVQDLASRLQRYAISAVSLPTDFSRSDIYRDHD